MAELTVDEDGLNEVSKTMGKDADDLDTSIERIIRQLEILRGIWEGQDADKFFGVAKEYFEKMRLLPRTMRNMEKFVSKTNKDIMDGDQAFSKELETEVQEEFIKEVEGEVA